jgi:hypothetical protein
MIETTSYESVKARGRSVASTSALVAAIFWWGGQMDMVAQAQAPFETPPVLPASELAPPDLLQGPMYTVDAQVPIVVALAATATSEDQARFLANGMEMLAAPPQPMAPLAEVVASGTVIGRTQSGPLIVPAAVDYVAWTEQVAGLHGER